MHFSDFKSHTVTLFVSSRILPVKLLYFKLVASLVHDAANQLAPPDISNLFICSQKIHPYPRRFSQAGNLHLKISRTNQQLFPFSRIGAKIWNVTRSELRELRKAPFQRKVHDLLLQILGSEEMNVEMRHIDLSKHMRLLSSSPKS